MKMFVRFLALIIVTILLFSSIIVVFSEELFEKDEKITYETDDKDSDNKDTNDTDEPDNEPEDQNNDTDNNIVENIERFVFIEEGTATWCSNCPTVADHLHDLYDSDDYNFYYVALVDDKSQKAAERLDEYNIQAYPTVFIDGGYSHIVGAKDLSEFENKIELAQDRNVAQIKIIVTSTYDNNTNELTTEVFVKNYEDYDYTGNIKIYLTEILSRWKNPFKAEDGEQKPYHYAFLDFIVQNKEITVQAKGEKSFSETKKLSDFDISDLNPEELMIIGVIFNKDPVKKTYTIQDEEYEYNAYFADACNATRLLPGGNLPPIVNMNIPSFGYIHLFGNPVFELPYHRNTVLFGKTKISVDVEDDNGIEKVEFYVDDELISTDPEAPYEYVLAKQGLFKELFFHKHMIKVIAYDTDGKTTSDEIEVLVRI